MNDALSVICKGAMAGTLATSCMSLLMMLSKRMGIQGEHPPKRITQAALETGGAGRRPEGEVVNAMSAGAHLAFGAGSGALFTWLRERLNARQLPALQGMGFGCLVWLVSYKGWIPALRILPPAERDRPGRVVTMIAAHLVYGAVLGDLAARWSRRSNTALTLISKPQPLPPLVAHTPAAQKIGAEVGRGRIG